MKTVEIVPTFEGWQSSARALLREGVAPSEVRWRETASGEAATPTALGAATPGAARVPRQFLDLARQAAGAPTPCAGKRCTKRSGGSFTTTAIS